MNKYISFLTGICIILLLSCEEYEPGGTATQNTYSGQFVVAATCEEYHEDDTVIEDGLIVLISNSAANVENQIVIDTYIATFHIRGKFDVTGNPSGFRAAGSTPNILSNSFIGGNDFFIVDSDNEPVAYAFELPVPTNEGEEYDGMQFYTHISLEDGKITPKGATTIGGNISDKISMKIILHSEYLVFESYRTDEIDWTVPDVPEFGWRVKNGSRKNADKWKEHWSLDGYRYTGYPEDE